MVTQFTSFILPAEELRVVGSEAFVGQPSDILRAPGEIIHSSGSFSFPRGICFLAGESKGQCWEKGRVLGLSITFH